MEHKNKYRGKHHSRCFTKTECLPNGQEPSVRSPELCSRVTSLPHTFPVSTSFPRAGCCSGYFVLGEQTTSGRRQSHCRGTVTVLRGRCRGPTQMGLLPSLTAAIPRATRSEWDATLAVSLGRLRGLWVSPPDFITPHPQSRELRSPRLKPTPDTEARTLSFHKTQRLNTCVDSNVPFTCTHFGGRPTAR